ncbi:hypothetical protein LTS08_007478 [Lithohypha guttulata]|nr:hypothetical protein LTS08_007478 [Lithohypha guttulata]
MANARRRRFGATKPPEVVFVSTFAIVLLFALYSFGRTYSEGVITTQSSRVLRALEEPDLACRLVHRVQDVADQCAFIRKNCPDEEAGLISYLQLYYCSLSKAKPVAFAILVIWISLLFSTIGLAASDFLCVNLSTIAAVLGMSESLTGVTFLAFGNGSPDVFSTFAAMKSHSGSLAVGELMGAAGFITAVVTGSMAIIRPFRVGRKSFVRDVGFFAVAASFSLIFLRDGSLRLWECICMVGFYVFYVVFVVGWHWWQKRQSRIRLAELEARLQHNVPGHEELEVPDIEIDEESRPAGERSPLLRNASAGSIPTLMTPGTPAWKYHDNDDEDETRDRYLAELQSNMRVSRPGRDRRNTITPIRPSLIGAIEFRSVLNALEKRSTSSQSIGLRRYSDDGSSEPVHISSLSYPQLAVTSADEGLSSTPQGRNRAVSAGDAEGLHIDPDLLDPSRGTPDTAIYSPGGRESSTSSHKQTQSADLKTNHLSPTYTSQVLLSPAITISSDTSSPRHSYTEHKGMLAPPSAGSGTFQSLDYFEAGQSHQASPLLSPNIDVPKLHLPDPGHIHRKSPLSHQIINGTSPNSSRPPSIRLPPPSMSPESGAGTITLLDDGHERQQELRRYNWWPYQYLPAPQVILATFFPQLYQWRDIGIIGRMIALGTAPMVFLLTVTLPVVEPAEQEEAPEAAYTTNTTPARSRSQTLMNGDSIPPTLGSPNGGPGAHPHGPMISRHNTDATKGADMHEVAEQGVTNQREWNRWLVVVQLFTAPLFVVLIVFANLDETHNLKELLVLVLGSLVFSLLCLLLLLSTTSATREPKYRYILCFLGFFVAIAWISTIAGEVVGVLKAIGVILDMSDAILGLTIFAVGNSLGDLVADVTIARLGYPMMALSACFGGPMLNILLGIGLGGMYMTIHHGQHRHHKHPNKPIQYTPYELEVSTTLMFSGISLLVVLCGLLIFVPLNGWRMDRKIGIGLIVVWALSTTGNVVCEVLGVGQEEL